MPNTHGTNTQKYEGKFMSGEFKVSGTVKDIWRYAVKSMGGETISDAVIVEGGILGDRGYALIDQATGKVVSAKLPKLWGGLLELGAVFTKTPKVGQELPPVVITWPDGTEVISSSGDPEGKLTQTVGRTVYMTTTRPKEVSLERLDPLEDEETILDIGDIMMEGRFSDYAAMHVVTTSSLDRLQEIDPEHSYDERRFRPNVVIDTASSGRGFIENDWVGHTLCIGPSVRLHISDPTPRCAVPTLPQRGGITKNSNILRTIVEHNSQPIPLLDDEILPSVGVYGFVLQGGEIKKDDAVRIDQDP